MGKYILNSLSSDEKVLYEAETSVWICSKSILVCLVLVLMSLYYGDLTNLIGIAVILGVILVWASWIAGAAELGLTSRKVIGKNGIIRTKVMESPLNKVQNVSVSNGLLGKIFNFGTIKVSTTSGMYTYRAIKYPDNFRAALMEEVENFEQARIRQQAQEMASAMRGNGQ